VGILWVIINRQKDWTSRAQEKHAFTRTVPPAAPAKERRFDCKTVFGEGNRGRRQGEGQERPPRDQTMITRFWNPVQYRIEDLSVATVGLTKRGQSELVITVDSTALVREAQSFLQFVVAYLDRTGVRITPHQTMNYGYWLVKFEPIKGDRLDVWEYNPELTQFLHGGSLALRYWRQQHQLCDKCGADFDPPNPGKLTSVSAGVMEGRPVQAVRYRFGEPMSGWLMVTDQYDGNIHTLTNHHTYHISAARPDLAKFLALPSGFRFDQVNGDRVWFDAEVASFEPTP
jgi:hypothetical protein